MEALNGNASTIKEFKNMKNKSRGKNTPQLKKVSRNYKRNKKGYKQIIKAFNDEIEQARYYYNF